MSSSIRKIDGRVFIFQDAATRPITADCIGLLLANGCPQSRISTFDVSEKPELMPVLLRCEDVDVFDNPQFPLVFLNEILLGSLPDLVALAKKNRLSELISETAIIEMDERGPLFCEYEIQTAVLSVWPVRSEFPKPSFGNGYCFGMKTYFEVKNLSSTDVILFSVRDNSGRHVLEAHSKLPPPRWVRVPVTHPHSSVPLGGPRFSKTRQFGSDDDEDEEDEEDPLFQRLRTETVVQELFQGVFAVWPSFGVLMPQGSCRMAATVATTKLRNPGEYALHMCGYRIRSEEVRRKFVPYADLQRQTVLKGPDRPREKRLRTMMDGELERCSGAFKFISVQIVFLQ